MPPCDLYKCLRIKLALGFSSSQVHTFYLAVFFTIASYVFMNAAQPNVLADILELPEDERGRRSGDLNFYSELVIISTVSTWGTLSDKIGRRIVFVAAFPLMAAGIFVYPFAPSYWVLVIFRLVFALGASAASAMLTAVLSDCFQHEDKGRAAGLMGLVSGLGAVFAAIVLLRVPQWVAGDTDDVGGIRVMYIVYGAALCAVSVVVAIGLYPRAQSPLVHGGFVTILKEGFSASMLDVRLALAYCVSFVARGDSVVLTLWLSQWVNDYVRADGGSSDKASAKAGEITGIAQTCALVFAPVTGMLVARVGSIGALVTVAVIAAVGYTGIAFCHDPTSALAIVMACIIGMGEIGVIVAGQSLVTQLAPPEIRGSVSGTFGFCGSIGILVCTKGGGALYDNWRKSGPFVLFSAFNFVVIFASTVVLLLKGSRPEPPKTEFAEGSTFAPLDSVEPETQRLFMVNVPKKWVGSPSV